MLQKTMRETKNDYMVVKTNANRQSKSLRRGKVVDENDLCLNVPYSLNRKYRFQELSPWSIIGKAQKERSSVGVLEQLNTNRAKNVLASAYYEVGEDGNVVVKTARGIAANANTLIEKPKPKRRGRARRKEAEGLIEEEHPQWHPDILYTLSKSHPSPAKSKISAHSGPKICIRKRNNNSKRLIDEECLEECDDELSETEEHDDLTKESLASKEFDLREFILQPSKKPVKCVTINKKKGRRESVREETSDRSAFELVEFPKEIRDSIFQLIVNVRTRRWKKFDFLTEVRDVFENPPEGCQCFWVARNEQAIAVHFYEVDRSLGNDLFPFLKILLESPVKGIMRMTADGNFKLNIPEHQIMSQLFDSRPTGVKSLITAFIKCANRWKTMHYYTEVKKFTVPAAVGGTAVSGDKIEDYNVTLFGRSYFGSLQVVDDKGTASILANEYEKITAEGSNDFEVISLNEDQCAVCTCSGAMSALSCYHDVCIDCLRDSIFSQIKSDVFPPACCIQGCETPIAPKLLLSLLPVCTYTFFVKRSLIHIKKRSQESVASCPICLDHGVLFDGHLHAVTCSKCNSCFCLNCGSTPHWPLNCEEFILWSSKFNQQYPFEILRMDGKLKEEMIIRECSYCKQRMEAADMVVKHRCFCTHIDWATGKSLSGELDRVVGWNWQDMKQICVKDLTAKVVSRYKPACFISRQFASVVAEARRSRLDSEEAAKFSSGVSRHNICKEHPVGKRIYDIRNFALFIVEYGTAWLYLHRHDENVQSEAIRSSLSKTRKALENLTARVQMTNTERNKKEASVEIDELLNEIDEVTKILGKPYLS